MQVPSTTLCFSSRNKGMRGWRSQSWVWWNLKQDKNVKHSHLRRYFRISIAVCFLSASMMNGFITLNSVVHISNDWGNEESFAMASRTSTNSLSWWKWTRSMLQARRHNAIGQALFCESPLGRRSWTWVYAPGLGLPFLASWRQNYPQVSILYLIRKTI